MHSSRKPPRPFSIILFDLGNVLIKVDYPAFLRTLKFDHSMNEKDLYTLLEDDSRAYEMGRATSEEYFKAVNEKLGTTYTFPQLRKAWNAILPEPVSGMSELIERLISKYRLMVLSNTNAMHCEHMLKLLPVLRRFERLFLSYKLGALKPDPLVYDSVLSQVDVPARKVLFIDDLEANIHGARESGMAGIVFQGVEPLREELTRLGVI
jgi:HAD superfamily hydrolase (TIGR01509 family)